MKSLIDKLAHLHSLSKAEWVQLINNYTDETAQYLFTIARNQRQIAFGTNVYLRGLIEISNYCKNDCFYCGIRRSNLSTARYRLSEDEIIDCCRNGHQLGFRTFVLQGGEDSYFTDERLCSIIHHIRQLFPDSAITLSLGEKSRASYQQLYDAGADRYLLRHETATAAHYALLHPSWMSFTHRIQCLYDLKDIGFQVGTGFMVGSPFQTAENLAEDMLFIEKLQPQMVGIGPFIPHHATPFANQVGGTAELTLFMLGLLRLLLPGLLLPATTALGTIDNNGRELGLLAGANVVMPNLSPIEDRQKYMIYDNKLTSGAESAEGLAKLVNNIESVGYHVEQSRGDAPDFKINQAK